MSLEKKTENFRRTVILYHVDCAWEMDYVFQELLRDLMPRARVFFMDSKTLGKYRDKHPDETRIVIFSSSTVEANVMRFMFESLDPHIVFHFSDEFGTKPEYCELAKLTRVFFHQHRFAQYPRHPSMVHIPLGFKVGYLYSRDGAAIQPATERELKWSFVGTLKAKSNRKLMVDTMQQNLKPHFLQTDGRVSTHKMGEIYAKSVFVPNDRGDVVLDCFRLYEAMLAGAIPVVVGARQELEQTFLFGGSDDYPPFLIAPTWPKAELKCQKLLAETRQKDLLDLQQKNVAWIHRHLNQIRSKVRQLCVASDNA